MLQLKDLCKTYQPSEEVIVKALSNVNLTIPPNGLTFLLGPSGCGKSTMLNILGGLDSFTSGDFLIDDISTKDFNDKDWDDYRNKRAGFVFQDYNLIEEFNVYDNVEFALDLQKTDDKKTKVENALAQVGLLDKKDKKIYNLSGGERQRVSIARAIVKEPQILLADEPTGNLDVGNSEQIFQLLKELSKHRVVVVVTHDENFARAYADHIIYLRDGEVVEQVTMDCAASLPEVDSSVYGARHIISKGMSFLRIIRQSFINMWHTKWKMLSAVVLLIFSLALFGAGLSATRYDKVQTLLDVYESKGISSVSFAQRNTNVRQARAPFSLEETERVVRDLGAYNLKPIHSTGKEKLYYKTDVADIPVALQKDFGYMTKGYQVIDQAFVEDMGFKLMDGGAYPVAKNEMIITEYTAEVIRFSESYKELHNVGDNQSLVGKEFVVDFMDYLPMKVVGILDTGLDDTYINIKYGKDAENKLPAFNEKLERESYSYNNLLYVSKEFKDTSLQYGNQVFAYTKYVDEIDHERAFTLSSYKAIFGKQIDGIELKDKEVMLGYNTLLRLLRYEMRGAKPQPVTDAQKKEFVEKRVYTDKDLTFTMKISPSKYLLDTEIKIVTERFKVVGINYDNDYTIISDIGNTIKSFDANTIAYSVKLTDDNKTNKTIIDTILNSYDIMDGYAFDVELAQTSSEPMMLFGMLGSALFCIFGVLMLVSFIVDNIKVNNYQIGVMRCLGVKRKDVIVMFLIESLIVALIAFMFACALFFPITSFMQRGDQSTYLIKITVFEWKFVDIFAMFALGVGVALITTIIPILSKTKEKPINILRSLE